MINNKDMNFDETHKNKVGEQLTKTGARALKDGEITEEEMSVASSFILDNIDNITDHSQLINFLINLSQKWPVFANVLTLEQGEVTTKQDAEKINEVANQIKEIQVGQATKLSDSEGVQETGGQN